jgi:hypothetical protein
VCPRQVWSRIWWCWSLLWQAGGWQCPGRPARQWSAGSEGWRLGGLADGILVGWQPAGLMGSIVAGLWGSGLAGLRSDGLAGHGPGRLVGWWPGGAVTQQICRVGTWLTGGAEVRWGGGQLPGGAVA